MPAKQPHQSTHATDPLVAVAAALSAVGDLVAGDLLCVDAGARVVYANPSATRALAGRLPAGGASGTMLDDLLPASALPLLRKALASVAERQERTTLRLPPDPDHPFGGRRCDLVPLPGGIALTFLTEGEGASPHEVGEAASLAARAYRLAALSRGKPWGSAMELARHLSAEERDRELAEASSAIGRLAISASSVHEVADALMSILDPLLPSTGKALCVVTHDGMLEYVATRGLADAYRGFSRRVEASMAHLLTPGRVTVVGNIADAVPPDTSLAPPQAAALLAPLVARDRVIGMIVTTAPVNTEFDEEQRDLLRRLAMPVSLALDVLKMREEERRRTGRERMLVAALATMELPVLILSPDGRVSYANDAAVREYGYTREALRGIPLERLTGRQEDAGRGGDARDPSRRAGGRLGGRPPAATAGMITTPIMHQRRDGSTFPVSVTRAVIHDNDGRLAGEVLCVRNMTGERHVAEQLRQHEKLAALGSLVAGVAHELNNPLTGISAFAQLLLEDPLSPEQDESVRLIKREADRAAGVIRDLLLFSRKTEAQLDEVDVNALVQLTVRLRTYTLRTESIGVTLELDPDAPRVVADEQRLQQVLLNLLVNAEYAMHDTVERSLTLRTRRERDELVVEVADTGSGMDQETQRHIFEPFYTTKPPGVGTGLGLSVSYGIVQAHGGGITVDSAPGCGTTFRITLPTRRPASTQS